MKFAKLGVFLELDMFAAPSFAFPNSIKAPIDKSRITIFKKLIAEGRGYQNLVSHHSLTTNIMSFNGGSVFYMHSMF
ncbi:hypothetical protein GTW56_21830 [Bacillus sp. EB93]|nr:hypothetical protein [Peribacillus frigoritolerans]